jgi:dolichol-phosphate mannosyltransferase
LSSLKLVILLPAYNEEESIPLLFPKTLEVCKKLNYDFMFLVGEDGSNDQTAKILEGYQKNYPMTILKHPFNRGLGETMRDLFEEAAKICNPDDIIIRMDCDDTHEPEYIPLFIEKINEGYDVVSASRFLSGGQQIGVNIYRGTISYCANLFMKVLFPISGLREYSCGFRAYKASIVQDAILFFGNDFIQLKGLGFTCTLEKLVKFRMLGAKFTEIPFILRYDQKRSSSKMVSSVTTLGYLVLAILFHWPWGGWKSVYKDRLKNYGRNKDMLLDKSY